MDKLTKRLKAFWNKQYLCSKSLNTIKKSFEIEEKKSQQNNQANE